MQERTRHPHRVSLPAPHSRAKKEGKAEPEGPVGGRALGGGGELQPVGQQELRTPFLGQAQRRL